jgi:hypothetical protein
MIVLTILLSVLILITVSGLAYFLRKLKDKDKKIDQQSRRIVSLNSDIHRLENNIGGVSIGDEYYIPDTENYNGKVRGKRGVIIRIDNGMVYSQIFNNDDTRITNGSDDDIWTVDLTSINNFIFTHRISNNKSLKHKFVTHG